MIFILPVLSFGLSIAFQVLSRRADGGKVKLEKPAMVCILVAYILAVIFLFWLFQDYSTQARYFVNGAEVTGLVDNPIVISLVFGLFFVGFINGFLMAIIEGATRLSRFLSKQMQGDKKADSPDTVDPKTKKYYIYGIAISLLMGVCSNVATIIGWQSAIENNDVTGIAISLLVTMLLFAGQIIVAVLFFRKAKRNGGTMPGLIYAQAVVVPWIVLSYLSSIILTLSG